ncbi:DUF2511 domain-containing protein [Streptomyces sp. BE147]|uniref:DUF2511 domain-containing protein n=1 Tax=unclassified Streptomyces TaxID=2593676 RepID=UPI002E79EB2C|nr:DUF2511 domain-containing protein [Streptomyces sp. BE147]MEE1737290.1 DUF2511 domain-containing protein [Streptomyces sp. BE147]
MTTNTTSTPHAPHAPSTRRATARTPHALACLALTAVTLIGLAGCGGGGRAEPATKSPVPLPSPTSTKQQMSEKNLGYTWPLTVEQATAECREGDQAVVTVPDGTTYALNDRAESAGYPDLAPVRMSGDGGDPVSIGPLLSRTLKLCGIAS